MPRENIVRRAISAYRVKTLPEFLRTATVFGKDTVVGLLPSRLQLSLFYSECEFYTDFGRLSMYVPKDSYYTERSPNAYEPQLLKNLSTAVDEDTVFYDIGAYFGYYVEAALLLGVPGVQIHAFESNQHHVYVLERNCSTDDVHVNRTFVGAGERTNMMTIDSYATHQTLPDVIKIDVEGMELDVLKGAQTVIRTARPVLFVEVHPFSRWYTEEALAAFLRDMGYSFSVTYHQQNRISADQSLVQVPDGAEPRAYLDDDNLDDEQQPYLLLATPNDTPMGPDP